MFQTFFAAARTALFSAVAYTRSLVRRWGWKKTTLGAGAIVALLIILHALSGSAPEAAPAAQTRTVSVRSVAELSQETSGLSVAGIVSSKSEATVRAEKSGEVKALNYQLGDYAPAGAVVAEVENASERAAVAQAQAGVDAALAAADISGTSFAAAQSAAVNALLSAYSVQSSAIYSTADEMMIEFNTVPAQYGLRFQTSSNASKTLASDERAALNAVLARQKAAAASLSASADLAGEIDTTSGELRDALDLLAALLQTATNGIPDNVVSTADLASYKSDIAASRASVTTALAGLTTAKQTLINAQTSGGGGSSASAAAVNQAQAALASARANLEHTIIRAPISGTINSLSLKLGDYAQLGSPVLTVANNSALEVVTYVTEADARDLSVGSTATIAGTTQGTVTRIAPALDPGTKKIEVRVGINSPSADLINGQSVTVELARTPTQGEEPSRLTIPLAALKIGADSMSVFTVAGDNTLEPHTVTIGELLGDRVVVTAGLSADMRIVTDARGLRAGETVNLAQ